jgi:hypothetical protein
MVLLLLMFEQFPQFGFTLYVTVFRPIIEGNKADGVILTVYKLITKATAKDAFFILVYNLLR